MAALFIFSCIFKLGQSVPDPWFVGLESKEWVEKNPAKFHISFFLSFFFFWIGISYFFSSSLVPRK